MQADPVAVGVRDEAQAHVGGGVVEVTDEIHRLRAAFWTEHAVEFSGSDDLVGGCVWHGTTGRWREKLLLSHLIVIIASLAKSSVALLEDGVGEAAIQVSVDVSAALLHGPRV